MPSEAPRVVGALVLTMGCGFVAGRAACAQRADLSGYYQNVGVGAAAKNGAAHSALDAQRARLMWTRKSGHLSLDVAYEHTLWWGSSASTEAGGRLLSSTRPGGDWLHLDGTLFSNDNVDWRHRFDRLSMSYSRGTVSATLGRQAISWATTLFLTPADPFVPFDPSDPFREYRTGIDAARVQWYAGSFTVVDVVARPAETPTGRTLTALARVKTEAAGWEFSAWGGAVHDEAGGAVGVTRTVAGSAVRAESEFRKDSSGRAIARTAIGVDRRFSVFGRDVYAVIEYQHDPFGSANAPELPRAVASLPAARGELQVFGRDESALQLTYQVHPLVSAELVALANLRDGSVLFAPAASISVNDETNLRVGVFLPAGRNVGPAGPRSEYGPVPLTGYAALSVFF